MADPRPSSLPTHRPDPVAIDSDPAVLARIREPATALAVWHRGAGAAAGCAAGLDLAVVDDLHCRVDAADAAAEVRSRLARAGYPDDAAIAIAADAGLLATRFAAVTGARRTAVRLEVVETDACRRFHADL